MGGREGGYLHWQGKRPWICPGVCPRRSFGPRQGRGMVLRSWKGGGFGGGYMYVGAGGVLALGYWVYECSWGLMALRVDFACWCWCW